uniref:Zinc finger protein 142 n=1 Tax=Neogobius melanostomus TaxID=47308 RepID=A0A8C6TBD7_9GOBI
MLQIMALTWYGTHHHFIIHCCIICLSAYLTDSTAAQSFRTHRCPKCDRCFKMRSHLQEHLNLHFPDPNLQCPTCKRHFTSKSKLRVHQLREAGLKSHRCHLCRYSAVERNSLRRHLVSVHGEKSEESTDLNFACPVCNESFCQSKSLKVHMKTHNMVKSTALLSCVEEGCSYKDTLFLLLKHITETHDFTPIECQHHNCVAIFKTPNLMKEHYKTHQAYHCADCDFSCSNKRLFTQHRRQGHAGGQQLSCEFCDFKTFNSVEFERHIEHLHASEKIHKCPQCEYTTAHKRGLKRHMLTHSGEKPYKCAVCDFRCRDEWYLSRHMLTHSDSKNHMCSECGYVTKWKHYLTVHMRKHTGDLRYHCDQCSYRCHRADQLSSHKLRHQEKSLICEVCAYSCKRKYELRQHMLSKHSETDQPAANVYKCKYCTYTTSYRQALHNHENCKHTKAREFRCALCSYTSFSSVSLFLHKRKTHGYVPGDKAWLRDYALKEKEKSTIGNAGDFYNHATFKNATGAKQTRNFSESKRRILHACLTALTSNDEEASALQESSNILTEVASDSQILPKSVSLSPTLSSEGEEEDATFDGEENDFGEANRTGEATGFEKGVQSGGAVKDLKELDKLQSASMVSDGHVEMLMVPTTKASGVVENKTRKIRSARHGLRFSCQQCGAEFKQQRSLANHSKRKCPTKQNSEIASDVSACLDQEVASPRAIKMSANSFQDRKTQSSQTTEAALLEKDRTYVKINNKFECERCGFSAVRLATIERHAATCRRKSSKKMATPNRSKDIAERSKKEISGRRATAVKKLNCSECEFIATSVPSLLRHRALSHNKAHFHCEYCAFSCQNERRLLQHVAVKHHNNKNPFQCRFCRFSTKRKYRLEEHESVHTGVGRHACDTCGKTFGALGKLRKHTSRLHDKTATHLCALCDFAGFSQDDIKRHRFRCHSGEMKFRCGDCGAKFSSRMALRNHCKRAHRRTLTCGECDYTCSSSSELNAHQNRKHQSEKGTVFKEVSPSKDLDGDTKALHACQLCPFSAKTKKLLAQHLSKEHEDGPEDGKPLKCSQCGFTCRHQLVLEQHLRSHGGKRVYKCTQCEYSSVNKQKMTWHVRTHTGDKPYSCEECSYTCAEPSRLKQHMRVHQEERKYLCPECGYKCKWATQLKLHMTKHTGEKRFACPDCEYRCSRADALRSHRSTQHSSSRPFVCENCGKSFKTAFVLRTHQQQHSDARPYSCGLCHKAFKWPAGLRHHFLSHTEQTPFCCRVCPYRAKQRFQVMKHLKRHHPEVRAEEGVERDGEVGG